jgi:hypothetical protein
LARNNTKFNNFSMTPSSLQVLYKIKFIYEGLQHSLKVNRQRHVGGVEIDQTIHGDSLMGLTGKPR